MFRLVHPIPIALAQERGNLQTVRWFTASSRCRVPPLRGARGPNPPAAALDLDTSLLDRTPRAA